MNYNDSLERSAEVLKQALQRMRQHGAALHPVNYALWYDYVRGQNPRLCEAVDQHLSSHLTIDEATAENLFRQHVNPQGAETQAVARVTDQITGVLGSMAESTARAGDQTARYGSSLSRLSEVLGRSEPGGHNPAPLLDEVLRTTREMQQAVHELRTRLADSEQEIGQLRQELDRVREESMLDGLTGLPNRRAFDRQLASSLSGAARRPGATGPSLLFIDIDHFKRVNDTFGHAFGDQVLRAVGQLLRELTPEDALPARLGGEEFALLMPASPLGDARSLAHRLRERVAAARIKRHGQVDEHSRITISIGVTAWRPGEPAGAFMERADQALYASKGGGRNKVTVMAG